MPQEQQRSTAATITQSDAAAQVAGPGGRGDHVGQPATVAVDAAVGVTAAAGGCTAPRGGPLGRCAPPHAASSAAIAITRRPTPRPKLVCIPGERSTFLPPYSASLGTCGRRP